MLEPKSDEAARGERLPWVTAALAALLLAGFVGARGWVGLTGDSTPVELDSAFELWLNHPYLALDPQLLAELKRRPDGDSYAERMARARAEAGSAPEAARAESQAELDLVTALALRGTDAAPGPNHPFRRLGWVPASPQLFALGTYWTLHAGSAHLLGVLLLLWLAGPALERAFGRGGFAALCLLGVLAAALAYLVSSGGARAPLVGAAGIAAALAGACGVRNGRDTVRIAGLGVGVPGWAAPALWVAVSGLFHFALAGDAVALGESLVPSLASLAAGAGFAAAARSLRLEERRAARRAEARAAAQLDPRTRRAQAALDRGSHDQAISLATELLRERPDDAGALAVVWSAHQASGRETQGLPAAKRLLEIYARHGALAPAARVWDELVRAAPEARAETTVLLRIVPELVVQARREAAIAALRCVVTPDGRAPLSVGQAVRAAELAAELDTASALAAARVALASTELADEKRERLAKLVQEFERKLETAPPAEPPPPPEPVRVELALDDNQRTVVYTPPPENTGPSAVKVTLAVPLELDPDGVRMRVDGAEPSLLTWERIQAVGVGLVSGLGAKPVVVIDLALNWADCRGGALEVLRLRSDSFRARALIGGDGSALEALRALLAQLLARSGAVPLPDAGAARGLPFREFPDPSCYERDVLLHAG
ncbi:MAG TPA: rhomboid family intramembrane serine protease [Myxococcota bacterium]|nr:rhomboid family intramembrane serine protease [Myxococcota bacterium]